MSTFREVIYMIMDEFKNISDDRYFEEEHIMYLIKTYRAFLLKLKYGDVRKVIPDANYLELNLTMELGGNTSMVSSSFYDELLVSTTTIPDLIISLAERGIHKILPLDRQLNEISLIPRERFKYIQKNRYCKNLVFATLFSDNKIYINLFDDDSIESAKVKVIGMFSDPAEVYKINENLSYDEILDKILPLEESLINPLIECIIKELSANIYRPIDNVNNGADNLQSIPNTNDNGQN